MNDPQDEKLIRLYQHSRQERPSETINQSIHKAAERALYRKRKRWLWGLSTAAIIVISFNVVLELMLDDINEEETVLSKKQQVLSVPPASTPNPVIDAPKDRAKSEKEGLSSWSSLVLDGNKEQQTADYAGNEATLEALDTSQQGDLTADADLELKQQQRRVLKESAVTNGQLEVERMSLQKMEEWAAKDQGLKDPVLIPELPVSLEELLLINSSIYGEQSDEGMITLYANGKIILSVSPGPIQTEFKAWPGSSVLGLKINWSMKPQGAQSCVEAPVYRICPINPQVKGFFKEDRLDYIQWFAPNG